jgi:hypothetical protein
VWFDEHSCRKDYDRLREIFVSKFSPYGYPCYFKQLLEYLGTCPAKEFSNTKVVIAFVINDPCFQPFEDRIKQTTILANILDQLRQVELQVVETSLGVYQV